MAAILVSAKVSVFYSKINTTITVSYPKGLTWHFIETEDIKHDYYSNIIM